MSLVRSLSTLDPRLIIGEPMWFAVILYTVYLTFIANLYIYGIVVIEIEGSRLYVADV